MNRHFEIVETFLSGLHVLQRKPIGDERGYFERLFCVDDLQSLIAGKALKQINHTSTLKRGTVRGMHFQYPPHAETKFVHCLRGEIFDVAVDVRRDSPTFLRWHGENLSGSNHKTLVIPEGFAHGFQALSDDCEMLYFHTSSYQAGAEGGIHAEDPLVAIRWPLPVTGLSPRDASHPRLDDAFVGIAP